MDIDKNIVDAILLALIEDSYIKAPTVAYSSEEDRKDAAEYWINEARNTWITNKHFAKNDKAITTILNLTGYPEIIKSTSYPREELITDKLPIPKEPDFNHEHLPADFTELTDMEIRKYSSHNQHFLNRARYLLSQVTNHQANAIHLRDDAYRKAYIEINDRLEEAGERTTKDLINSYATQDEEYKRYDEDARKAQENIVSLKALVEIYSGNVDRLSREWTMRQNEWEKTR